MNKREGEHTLGSRTNGSCTPTPNKDQKKAHAKEERVRGREREAVDLVLTTLASESSGEA